jgi:hypothetical protein
VRRRQHARWRRLRVELPPAPLSLNLLEMIGWYPDGPVLTPELCHATSGIVGLLLQVRL